MAEYTRFRGCEPSVEAKGSLFGGCVRNVAIENFAGIHGPCRANNCRVEVEECAAAAEGAPREGLLISRDEWSNSEKKIARRAFEAAHDVALAGILAEFKRRAAAVTTSDQMWDMEDYLRQQRRQIEDMFDYRYSQLLYVFALLMIKNYLNEAQLAGLSDDKLHEIRRTLAVMRNP